MTVTGIVAALVLGALLLVALYALKREQEAHFELRERCNHLQETVRRQRRHLKGRLRHALRLYRERREALDALNEVDEDRAHLLNERRRLLEELGCSCRGDDCCNFCRGHRPRPNDERGDSEDAANRRARHALDAFVYTTRAVALHPDWLTNVRAGRLGGDRDSGGVQALTRIEIHRVPPNDVRAKATYAAKWWAHGNQYGLNDDDLTRLLAWLPEMVQRSLCPNEARDGGS